MSGSLGRLKAVLIVTGVSYSVIKLPPMICYGDAHVIYIPSVLFERIPSLPQVRSLRARGKKVQARARARARRIKLVVSRVREYS